MTNPTHILLHPTHPDRVGPALLTWWMGPSDTRLVQVYVNGRLYDVTTDSSQRELWLHLDRTADARVGLLVVEAGRAWEDRSPQLDDPFVTEARLVFLRDESLPPDSRVVVTLDGVDVSEHPLWGPRDSRSGFGGLFGVGGGGFDDAAAPGFALGEFGYGPLGRDGFTFRWRRDDLSPSVHTIAARIVDSRGNTLAQSETQTVTIDAIPRPAREVTVDESFTLNWKA